jgi:hypothetical protein
MMTTRYSTSLTLVCALGLAACSSTIGVNTDASSTPPPGSAAPSVSLSAAPNPVASGGSTQLTWSSSNASGCNATGAWSGAKPTSGSLTINSITTATAYTLTCTGTGGSTTRSTIVNVTGGGGISVIGTVDSSLLDRHQESANLVYAFAGSNTTSGIPVTSVAVTQDVGACTFRYSIAGLSNGNYTIALTSDGGTSFRRSANVTVAGTTVTQDFAPARVLRVGPTRQFANPNDVTGIASGDVIEIDAGVYNGPATTWVTDNLTLRGVGGRAHIVAPATISNGKGTWVTQGANMAVENIEFSGAAVPDLNGSGIRAEGQDLAICGSYFHDNQEGILGGGGNVLIEYTEFARNGNCDDPSGCAHNIYIDNTDRFTLRYSYSHHASIGHLVKSRAAENYILYNRIMDEAGGTSSYQIDLPNGGLSYIVGNLLQQGPLNDNPILVTYGEEGLLRPNHTLYVVNNTFVNDAPSGGTFVFVQGGSTATVQNNLFVGIGTAVSGTATQTSNLKIATAAANFVDIGTFNYRPTATTPGIDQGTAPGLGGAFDLTPIYQYVHPTNREPRPVRNAIDIGAYEYNP